MSKVSYYTEEGLKKLKDELAQLENIERPRVTNEIAEARDKGDLSENAEYHAAKEEQSLLETKIAGLKNVNLGKEFTYTLVADSETDVANGKISVNSPIGKGLLGKEVGEFAEINAPRGVMKFEVLEISR